jgi:anti-anti-sigma regulatory factor
LQHYHGRRAEVLKFSGTWTEDNLAAARAGLTAATRRASNLVLDLDGVTFVDAAFLGQLLIAYGYQRRMQRGFSLRVSSRKTKGMMRLHGCGFLLSAEQKRPEANSPKNVPVSANGQGARKFWQKIAIGGRILSNFHER